MSTSLVGMAFGSYRVVRVLATSKATLIVEAIDDAAQERRALKLLQQEFQRNREQTAFLKREAEVGHGFQHPRVIRIYGFAQHRDVPYLVLELFAVPSMKLLLRQRPDLAAWLAPTILRQAAEGLAALHGRGWIHRDVKPENYLVGPQGDVKLIDFALAVRPARGLLSWLAGKPKVQGTRSYMSPEQIRGERLDARSDVYSFGCTAFELLAGRPPFTAGNPNELLMKHLKAAPPSLGTAQPNVTRAMSDYVSRMLSKKPANRPESMSDVVVELSRLEIFREPPPPPDASAR